MSFHGPVIIVGMGKPPLSDEMKEAIEKAVQAMWAPKEEKKMKYFRLRAYTPYCGEELTAVAKGESEHEVLASGLPDDLMADCAAEWFDPADYETFGYEDEEEYEEMYYQECGCEIVEISEAEYLEELDRL